jgi:hypothetical protein
LRPKVSVADSIENLRRRFPGALVCTTCARLIASTPKGYARSSLTSEQIENYVCAECRMEPVRAGSETARLRALPPKVHLMEPIVAARAYAPPQRRDESDAAYRRRVERWDADRAASHALLGIATLPNPYFGRCLVDRRHIPGSEYALECPARNCVKSLSTGESPAPRVDAEQSRAGSPRQQKRGSGTGVKISGPAAHRAPSARLARTTGGPGSDQRGSHEVGR